MSAELSSARADKRHPLDWCVEQGWEWDQVVRAIGIDEELADGVALWDPCAGYGHSGSRLEAHGFARVFLSDLVENVRYADFLRRPTFFSADFLEQTAPPATPVSIWFNPPFSYKKVRWPDVPYDMFIGEACVRRALQLATHRVVALFPIKWLAGGKNRGKFFRFVSPPQMILLFTQRPSMPPGDIIDQLGDNAFRNGKIDYCAVVWDVRRPTYHGKTRTIWLPTLAEGV